MAKFFLIFMKFFVSLHAELNCEIMYIKQSSAYFVGYILLFSAMVLALLLVPKGELHLWLNGCHTPFLDGLMKVVTYFAQWPLYVIALFLFCRRYSMLAYYAMSEAAAAIVVQAIKHFFNMPRPQAFFGDDPAFQQIIVEGVRMHNWHSFPSGHTQTFFVFFTVFVLLLPSLLKSIGHRPTINCSPSNNQSAISRQSIAAIAALLLATFGAYSRIYLSQHFLLDVCVGSCIGVVVPLLLLPLNTRMAAKWGNKGFLTH